MQSHISRYAPSGAFSPLLFAYTLGALLGAALLSGVYMVLVDLIPFIYVSFLLTVGFGFGLGMMGSFCVTGGHCRNRSLALGVGLVIGAVGLAASYGWGFLNTLRATSSESGVSIMELAQQVSIGHWIDARMQGGWRVRSTEITGIGVVVIWIVEAIIALGIPLLISTMAAADPYCEPCKAWTQSQTGSLKGLTREDVQPVLDRGDLAGLISMADHPDTDSAYRIQLQRHYCPQCASTAYLTVNEVRIEVKDGKEQESKTELLENAALNSKLSTQYVARFIQPEQGTVPVAGAAL